MDQEQTGAEAPQEVATSNTLITTFAEALASLSEAVAEDQDTLLPMESYKGSTFIEQTDPNRPIKTLLPIDGKSTVIRTIRTGAGESNGIFLQNADTLTGFGFDVKTCKPHTQATFKMANGKLLVGYVSLGKSRSGFYFPKKYAERVLTELPPLGKRLPIKVVALFIG
ncbi:MAG: hypothetical protein WBM13_07365 [Bacteroidia bacterium]